MQKVVGLRVQKVIADQGIASRRVAEKWITEGRVRVNGAVVELGARCRPGVDEVEVDGRRLPRRQLEQLVLAMNKPRGFVCANGDGQGNRTIFELLPPEFARLGLSCVGRLDKESEGLLILTNDGDLQQRLTHPSYGVRKLYAVEIDQPLRQEDIAKLRKGIRWEGERLAVDKVFPFSRKGQEDWQRLEVTLHHGKKREIRRLFYALGYDVRRLQRIQIGGFRLKGIPKGKFRRLEGAETRQLFAEPGATI